MAVLHRELWFHLGVLSLCQWFPKLKESSGSFVHGVFVVADLGEMHFPISPAFPDFDGTFLIHIIFRGFYLCGVVSIV